MVLITGTVGVGKTTTGHALAERLGEGHAPAAFLDLDVLSRLWPAPPDDPFREALVLRSLAALVDPLREAGARVLVLAIVVEDGHDVDAIATAVGHPVTVVRLISDAAVIDQRLHRRHVGPEAGGLDWHLRRAPELVALQDRGLPDAVVVDADRPLDEVVAEVTARVGDVPA